MGKLCCDICGGTLVMQSGGKMSICDSCGTQYSVERMREKVQEIKGIVSVEGTVKTQDTDFIIRGGVLERYNGNDTHVVIPDSVLKIGGHAFEGCVGIQKVTFPKALIEIGVYSFAGCSALNQVTLPETVKTIGNWAFENCTNLEVINIPDHVQRKDGDQDMYGAFWNCPLREIVISEEQKEKLFIYTSPYDGTQHLYSDIFIRSGEDGIDSIWGSWCANLGHKLKEENQRKIQVKRRLEGKCQHCGGPLSGIFTKKCCWCGKPKDY